MNWADDDEQVLEVMDENGGRFRYRAGRWYGGINPRTGRWDLRIAAEPGDAQRLNARVFEKKMERQREEAEAAAQEGQPEGGRPEAGRPRRRGWGAAAATALGAQAAVIAAGATALVTPVLAQVMSAAVQPLGGAGQALQNVGMGLVNFVAQSIRSVSYMGGALIGLALYQVLGPALATALGFLTAAGGQLLGNIGQLLGEAFQGLVGIFTDVNRVGRETADTIMNIAYNTGMAAEEATRLAMSLQAAGTPLQTINQLFGRWEARPEIMGPRLSVIGVDYEQALRQGDLLLQLHDRLAAMPDIMRVPMLRAALGPGAETMLPQIMRPREEIEEAQRFAEHWGAGSEAMERMQQHVEATQARVDFLGRSLRLHLLEGFLPIMQRGLEMLLTLWDQNRDAVLRFITQTAPEAFLRGIVQVIDWVDAHLDEILQAGRDFCDIVVDIARSMETAARWLGEIGRLWPWQRREEIQIPGEELRPGARPERPRRGSEGEWRPEGAPRPVQPPHEQGAMWDIHQGLKTVGLAVGGLIVAPHIARGIGALGGLLGIGGGAGGAGGMLGRIFGGANLAVTLPALLSAYQVRQSAQAGAAGRPYEGMDPFTSGLGMGAAVGWRFGGPLGAIIGSPIGALINPLLVAAGEIRGARRRVARTEAEIGPLGEAIRPELVRERLEALGSPREAVERESRTRDTLRQLRDVFSPEKWRQEMERAERQRQQTRDEVRITVEPSEDFLFRMERRIMTRSIQEAARELQQAMS